jgi:aminopeptidase N
VASPSPGASSSPRAAGPGAGTAIEPGRVDRTSLALDATYDATLALDDATGTVRVGATITLRNTSGGPIDRVELNTVAAPLGRIRLGDTTVDGRSVRPSVDDQTIVVPLGGILPAGATARLELAYRATLRSGTGGSDWLFSRANGVVALYRWLPWVSRRTAFERANFGDPFVTPISPSVRVTVTTARPLVVATSGRRVDVSPDRRRQTFEAANVRDFVITASAAYRRTIGRAGDTRIEVYTLPGGPAAELLAAARRSLERIEALLGPYPYPAFVVAQTGGGFGMEAPGLIWIPRTVERARIPYLVAHETAHQWFYALVGNDQAREPFADEAAADFVARTILGLRRASRCPEQRLDLSIYRYSAGCYYEVVYIQGGNFLDDLRRRIGSTAFWRALREYVADNRFGLARTRTLLDALDDATRLDLTPRYAPRFPSLY